MCHHIDPLPSQRGCLRPWRREGRMRRTKWSRCGASAGCCCSRREVHYCQRRPRLPIVSRGPDLAVARQRGERMSAFNGHAFAGNNQVRFNDTRDVLRQSAVASHFAGGGARVHSRSACRLYRALDWPSEQDRGSNRRPERDLR